MYEILHVCLTLSMQLLYHFYYVLIYYNSSSFFRVEVIRRLLTFFSVMRFGWMLASTLMCIVSLYILSTVYVGVFYFNFYSIIVFPNATYSSSIRDFIQFCLNYHL